MDRHSKPILIRLTDRQREMLDWLHEHQQRSRTAVVRLAIERVYQAEKQRAEAIGQSRGTGRAIGRS